MADGCGKKDLCFHSNAYLALSNVHLLGVIYTVVSCDKCVIVIIILCLCIILHIKLVDMIIMAIVILLLDTICKLSSIVAALETFIIMYTIMIYTK